MHIPLVVAKLITLTLGLLIAFQAFRGYQRNDSEAMLYLAVGFALISVGAVIEGLLFELLAMDLVLAGTVQTLIVAVGMLIILYSLYGSHGARTVSEH